VIKEDVFRTRRKVLRSLAGVALGSPAFSRALSRRGIVDVCGLVSIFPNAYAANLAEVNSQESALEFDSSDTALVRGFRWAKRQALAYVRTGDPVGPFYEATLPGRNAFCMRDTAHYSTGAQLLGLGATTRNMLRRFAENISASKKWCSYWEMTRENTPVFKLDYVNDNHFWYDLPCSFDVVDACYRQWLWTRNDAYLDDVFVNFYYHTATDYVVQWSHNNKDGLLEHLPQDGHMGVGTYDEDLQDYILVGADLVATQYAAYCGYAGIQLARNQPAIAQEFTRKAEVLRSIYNRKWWDASRNCYYAALGEDGKVHKDLKASVAHLDVELPVYFGLPDSGFKTQAALDAMEELLPMDENAIKGMVGAVEGRSYLPDIFYEYGRSRSGYKALLSMMDPSLKRREYPEASFTSIGNLGSGLMGIRPSTSPGMVETFPHLTEVTNWASMSHVPVGNNVISVRHTQNRETALSNEQGPALSWRVSFPGEVKSLVIDGRETPAEKAIRRGGGAESYIVLQVEPGKTRVASL